MAPSGNTKCAIVDGDSPSTTLVACLFNPAQYSVQKSIYWGPTDNGTPSGAPGSANTTPATRGNSGRNVPDGKFGGGQAATLTVELFFDTSEVGDDVRAVTDTLFKLTLIDPSKQQPPLVRFHWGSYTSFKSIITNLSLNFTYFLTDGTPVRATASVTFTQVYDASDDNINPPSLSGRTVTIKQNTRVHTMRPNETLSNVAGQYYGDPSQWRKIADANGGNPSPPPGTALTIPPK